MTSKTINLAGQTIHYADYGGEGPTVVLVHGLGGSHLNWLPVAPAMARTARVVALDLPGFGRSPRDPRGTSLRVMGEALARFVDAMSREAVHLVGNSMGGALSVLEAHARPGRVASTLLVCPALPPPPGGARVEPRWMLNLLTACAPGGHLLLRRTAAKLGPERQVRQLLALCCVDVTKVSPEVVDAHVALAMERVSTPWSQRAFAEATRSLMGHVLFGRRFRRALRAPGPPTLIVHGTQDRLVDVRASRAVAAANARISLTELPTLGHTPQLEEPDVFVEIASRWLKGIGSRPADRSNGALHAQ